MVPRDIESAPPSPAARLTTTTSDADRVASPPEVLASRVEDHPALTLTSADRRLQATFLPGLGMVCCSLLHDGHQLLDLRGGPAAYEQRGSSFGIPLLHPWANRLGGWTYTAGPRHVEMDPASPAAHPDSATGLPMHGLLTASRYWTVTQTHADSGAAQLLAELDFAAHPALLAGFPFPHRLALDASVQANRLAIRLTLTPTGPDRVPVSFGFHPYLRLRDSARRTWSIELPVARRAILDARGIPTGDHQALAPGELSGRLGDRSFDDSFDQLDHPDGRPASFVVADDRRRLTVELVDGYTVAHVFAPAASDFVCFEPMTAPVDALRSGCGLRWVEPGSHFAAEFAITVLDC
ncbi:MAG: aldose 1-epimerase [Solirubrobacteraceae bacterium]|nr:aldose 1-epimerase [Solirubrobacteraceae bacterium]